MRTQNLPRIVHVQPALPKYRLDFFHRSALGYPGETRVYYSPTDMGALTEQSFKAPWAYRLGPLRKIMPGIFWQDSALRVPKRKGDILVLSGNPRVITSLFLLLAAKLKGMKVVWWGHLWSSTTKRWRHFLRTLLMRFSDAILFYTDQEIEEYRSENRFRGRQLVYALNNGLDLSEIKAYRSSYSSSKREASLLFIGRITEKAKLDLALSALSLTNGQEISLNVIGDGPGLDSFKNYAEELGLGERVCWHGAITNEADIAAVANRARAFLYPGEAGLSLLHGMAYGLPAIVHADRWRHMPEIAAFEADVTGRSFEPLDAKDLAAQIDSLLGDYRILDAYSRASIEVVHEKFNTSEMARRFLALVQELEVKD